MNILLGFLIGLAYAPMLVIVVAAMIAGRSSFGIIAGVVSLIALSGPVVWIMTFIALGVAAGFAAFGGWILGLGVAAIMAGLLIASRLRKSQSSTVWAGRG